MIHGPGRNEGKQIAVIGAGSWGTTLANLLAEKVEGVIALGI